MPRRKFAFVFGYPFIFVNCRVFDILRICMGLFRIRTFVPGTTIEYTFRKFYVYYKIN